MSLSLRPYQRAAIDALYDYFAGNIGNPLVVIPTAGGKSVVIAGFIREAIAAYADTRVLMLTHQRELISQNFQALLRAWPEAPDRGHATATAAGAQALSGAAGTAPAGPHGAGSGSGPGGLA
jgi:DNA repair protein RadD